MNLVLWTGQGNPRLHQLPPLPYVFCYLVNLVLWIGGQRNLSPFPPPRAENDKINVLDEPYFCTHILSNHPPSSGAPKAASGTQSSPQRSQVHSQKQQHSATNFHKRPAIQWVAPVIRKVKVSRHSFIASLGQTLVKIG